MVNIVNKINKHGEITTPMEFYLNDSFFYLHIVPKSLDTLDTPILEVMLSHEKKLSRCPFATNCWEPVLINRVKIEQDTLDKFFIFWGTE